MTRAGVLLAVLALLAGCTPDGSSVSARPSPTPAPTAEPSPEPSPTPQASPSPDAEPKPVSRVAGIELFAFPEKLAKRCRDIDRTTSFRLLCPGVFPERTKEPTYGAMLRPLRDGKRFYGVEIGYSAPYENQPKKNRPEAFVHYLLMNGESSFGVALVKKFKKIGKRRYGTRRGTLYRARGAFSIHFEHYVFVWRERGTSYVSSLHRWDRDRQTLALLERLTASLKPAR